MKWSWEAEPRGIIHAAVPVFVHVPGGSGEILVGVREVRAVKIVH